MQTRLRLRALVQRDCLHTGLGRGSLVQSEALMPCRAPARSDDCHAVDDGGEQRVCAVASRSLLVLPPNTPRHTPTYQQHRHRIASTDKLTYTHRHTNTYNTQPTQTGS
jgi:hypothetical protein